MIGPILAETPQQWITCIFIYDNAKFEELDEQD